MGQHEQGPRGATPLRRRLPCGLRLRGVEGTGAFWSFSVRRVFLGCVENSEWEKRRVDPSRGGMAFPQNTWIAWILILTVNGGRCSFGRLSHVFQGADVLGGE